MKYLYDFKSYLIKEAFDLNRMHKQYNIVPEIQEQADAIVDGYFSIADEIPADMKRDKDKVIFWLARQIKRHIVDMYQVDYDSEYNEDAQSNSTIYTKNALDYVKGKVVPEYAVSFIQSNLKNDIKYHLAAMSWEQKLNGIFDYFLSPMRNQHESINFVTATLMDMDFIQREWHENIKSSGKIFKETGDIIMTFPDGYYWIDLKTNTAKEEAQAMGHCGRTNANTILSLRKKSDGGFAEAFVTIAIDYQKGSKEKYDNIRQIKGKNNKKPIEKYHPYIVELLLNDELGITKLSNDEYASHNDFHIMDLKDDEKIAQFLKEKPTLFI